MKVELQMAMNELLRPFREMAMFEVFELTSPESAWGRCARPSGGP